MRCDICVLSKVGTATLLFRPVGISRIFYIGSLDQGCQRTWKTWRNVHFLRKSVKSWKSQGEMLEKHVSQGKSGNYSWVRVCHYHTLVVSFIAHHCPETIG